MNVIMLGEKSNKAKYFIFFIARIVDTFNEFIEKKISITAANIKKLLSCELWKTLFAITSDKTYKTTPIKNENKIVIASILL